MVKFIAKGPIENEQSKGVPGVPSFYFDLEAKVTKSTSREYVVEFDALGGLPSLPNLPNLPGITLPTASDNPPDQWFGRGLKYEDITLKGYTTKVPSEGQITRYLEKGDNYRLEVTGLKIDVEDFFRVSSTLSNKDNQAFNRKIFSKDDVIKGGSVKDKLDGFNGNDTVRGGKGNDEVSGGNGNDKVFGDAGNDKVFGDGGRDKLKGGKGNDTLNGGKGNDTLTGDGGNDKFVFKKNFGKNVVTDFNAKSAREDIDLSGVKPIKNFNDLSNNHMSQRGDDVVIKAGKNTIRLEDVEVSDLQANDFIF